MGGIKRCGLREEMGRPNCQAEEGGQGSGGGGNGGGHQMN